jgi:hypothetical protein
MLVIRVNTYKNERIYMTFYWMKKNKNTTTFAPINHTWNLLKGKNPGKQRIHVNRGNCKPIENT